MEYLPTDITLQATYEMFELRSYGNSIGRCADYTLSFAGPGKYFESEAKAAKKRGLRLYSMTNTGGLKREAVALFVKNVVFGADRTVDIRFVYQAELDELNKISDNIKSEQLICSEAV